MIEFNDVSVTFKHSPSVVEAVKNVSLKIDTGVIYGIVGGSGAGKSTLLRTINLLQPVTGGRVLIDGQNIVGIKGKKLRELRKNIGMIFQHFNLAESKTVYQNISFMLETSNKEMTKQEIEKRVDELLDFVNISDKRNVYPSKLSGGQKQRVAIARALANNSKILLCDEPTSALDAETTSSVLELLKKVNRELKVTIVIITHELDVVKKICNRIAVMNDGELVEDGEVYDVFTNPKADFTKQLIAHTQNFILPEEIIHNLHGDIVKLTYKGDSATESILSETAALYDIKYNILHGKIEYIASKPLGILYVNIVGDHNRRAEAIQYLLARSVKTEVIFSA